MPYASQSKQDELMESLVFKGFRNGFFVNIGAWDGLCFDNTLFFETERNWTGINIEPLPKLYAALVQNRPACKNLNLAISDRDGSAEFLAIDGHPGMLSGLTENYDERHLARIAKETAEQKATTEVIHVPVKRLDTLFKEHDVRRVHYLSIDAEGSEFNILRSIDFSTTFVDVIDFEKNGYGDRLPEILPYLESKGYRRLPIHHWEDVFLIHQASPFAQSILLDRPKLALPRFVSGLL